MALKNLDYSKDWTETNVSSSKYFKTKEDNETKVRADMQLLYSEIQQWANDLVSALGDSSNLGLGEAAGFGADVKTVKAALIQLKNDATERTIPDYSLGNNKLKRKSVEGSAPIGTDNIADLAITESLIADEAIVARCIAEKAIVKGALAEYESNEAFNAPVGTKNIQNGAITNEKLASYTLTHNKLATTANPDGAAVDTENIVDSAITTAKIADGNVTTAKIKDGGVTSEKLAGQIPLSKLVDNYVVPIAHGGTGKTVQETVTLDVTFKDGTTGSYTLVKV